MTVEWSITVGNIVTTAFTVLGFIVAALGFFYALRSSLEMQGEKISLLSGRMINVENEIKELKNVLIKLASQEEKLSALAQRMDRIQSSEEEWRLWITERFDRLNNRKGA